MNSANSEILLEFAAVHGTLSHWLMRKQLSFNWVANIVWFVCDLYHEIPSFFIISTK